MSFANVNIGTYPSDSTGDPIRVAFNKINQNFANIGGTTTSSVETVAGRTGNVVLTVNDVLGAASVGYVNGAISDALYGDFPLIASNIEADQVAVGNILLNSNGYFRVGNADNATTHFFSNGAVLFGDGVAIHTLALVPGAGGFIQFADGTTQDTASPPLNLYLSSDNDTIDTVNGNPYMNFVPQLYLTAGEITTASNDGTLVVSGGIGVSGNIYCGTDADGRIQVGSGGALLPDVIAQFTSNTAGYTQINAQNLSNSPLASSDFVATANNGDDTHNFIDLGIASSTYNFPDYQGYKPNDGYLLTNGGNLIINADTTDKTIKFMVGGHADSDVVGLWSHTGLEVTQNINIGNILLSSNGFMRVGNTNGATTHFFSNGAVSFGDGVAVHTLALIPGAGGFVQFDDGSTQDTAAVPLNLYLSSDNDTIDTINGNPYMNFVPQLYLTAGEIATASNDGTLVVSGGIGVSGNIYCGTDADGRIQVGSGGALLPDVIAQFTSNTAGYTQINAQNLSNSPLASSDFVATADNGDDSHNFIDLGIASSTYNFPDYQGYKPNDGYLLVNGGNLIINTDTIDKSIKFMIGGHTDSDVVGTWTSTELTVNTNLVLASPDVPGSANATGVTGQIAYDSNYVYICVATNTWKRSSLSTW